MYLKLPFPFNFPIKKILLNKDGNFKSILQSNPLSIISHNKKPNVVVIFSIALIFIDISLAILR